MRLKIQVTRLETSAGKGGTDVAMTVIDSRIPDAVFGIARTIVQGYSDHTELSEFAQLALLHIC
jgi:hypothetical protein